MTTQTPLPRQHRRHTCADPTLDWRFLGRGRHLGRVGTIGPVSETLTAALAVHGPVVRPLPEETEPLDTIVVGSHDPASVALAVACLAPGGVLHLPRPAPARRTALRRELEAAGLAVSTWWHRPDLAAPTVLVRLDHPGAPTVLRTVGDRRRRTEPEAWAARSGLAARWSPHVSILARRPAVDDRGSPLRTVLGTEPAALVTPRWSTSHCLVAVTTGADGRGLHSIAKFTRDGRRPEPDTLAHEAAILAEIEAAPAGVELGPVPARLRVLDGQDVLVEPAAPGRPVDRRLAAAEAPALLRAAVRWCERVPVGPASAPAQDGRIRLLTDALDRVRALPHGGAADRTGRLIQAEELLRGLAGVALPVVLEHGDLAHPNLFLTNDGELAAIDWERSLRHGLPLQDLAVLLGQLAPAHAGRRQPAGEALAAALRPGGWAAGTVAGHARTLGIPSSAVGPLVVAAWTRQLASLPEELVARPTVHRYDVAWAAVVDLWGGGLR